MDPALLQEALADRARQNRLLKAVIVVHLYGQSADMEPIMRLCAEYGVPLIEDAAEALGTTYRGQAAGSFGYASLLSFNGSKIITTSSGGALLTSDEPLITHARKLAIQAREPIAYYEHTEIGYNYRLSNLLAGIGLGQLKCWMSALQNDARFLKLISSCWVSIQGLCLCPMRDGAATHAG